MKSKDLSLTLLVDQSPEEVFNAINYVRGWWSETIEGDTLELNDEFIYRYKDLHFSKQKLTEVVPGKKVVWNVLDSSLSFIKKKDEWTGTNIIFEIKRKGEKTEMRFTHVGLVPGVECYVACLGGWTYYIKESLLQLIISEKGKPNKKELKKKEKLVN